MSTAREKTLACLAKHAKVSEISEGDKLFGSGINLSSISFAEFIMEFEEIFDLEADINGVDESVVTVGDLLGVLREYNPDL